MWGSLIRYIREENEQSWRLAALSVLAALPVYDHCEDLRDFLRDQDRIFLRGVIVLLGQKGPGALPLLCDFAATTVARGIKDEILVDAIYKAAGGDLRAIESYITASSGFRRFWQYQMIPDGPNQKYDIFPYPDYLWQIGRNNGIKKSEYKRLHYRARNKKAKDIR